VGRLGRSELAGASGGVQVEALDRVLRWMGALTCAMESSGLALAGLWASFSRFRASFFWLGLFREILVEMFVDLGRNSKGKLVIPRGIQRIGAKKFVAM
jgi:hypothetical protein